MLSIIVELIDYTGGG